MTQITSLDDNFGSAAVAESEIAIESARAITSGVFGCEAIASEDFDPEFPEHRYVVFSVAVEADPETIVRLEGEWARRIRSESGDWKSFRLSIKPRP